jgi:hypothetical protein
VFHDRPPTRDSRYVALTLPRRWIRDLVYFGTKSMVVGGWVSIEVAAVAAARRKNQPLISWNAILVKALAITSNRWPELRRVYIPFPWPHLYQHPECVVSIVLEREWRGERAVFFDQIQGPEHLSLRNIDATLRGMKRAKIESLGGYRRLIRITRLPYPLRRLLWRLALYCSGRLKSRYFGTISLNSPSVRRLRMTQSVTPVTLSFEYGAFLPNGEMPLQVFMDHRVIDGLSLSRLCSDLEAVLNHDIVAELEADKPRADLGGYRGS